MTQFSSTRFIGLGLALVCAATTVAQDFPDDYFYSGAERSAVLKSMEGQPAAALQLDAWIGEETSIEAELGNVIIVDFWATWCGPCMAAIPKNVSLVEKFADDGLRFIGVHDSKRGWDKAASVVAQKNINYPVARDAGGASTKAFNLSFWPTYIAIDREGIVRAAGLTPNKVEAVIQVLLAEAGGPTNTRVAKGEFPIEYFDGAEQRLPSLAKLETKKAPRIEAEEWLTDPESPMDPLAFQGRVLVLRFLSPVSRATRVALPAWRKTAKEFQPQGVAFLGICDHLADWDRMSAMLGKGAPPFAVGRDKAPTLDEGENPMPLGVTATRYGIRGWPTTIVIDRSGRVRAAGLQEKHLRAVVEKLLAEPSDTAR